MFISSLKLGVLMKVYGVWLAFSAGLKQTFEELQFVCCSPFLCCLHFSVQQVCNFMDLIFKNGGNVQPQEEHFGEEVATSRLPYSQRVTTADNSNLPNRTPSRDQTRDLSGNV